MSETKKIVNTKYTPKHIELIKIQAVMNKRTFHDELENILNEYFQNTADQKAFNDCNPSNPTEKTK